MDYKKKYRFMMFGMCILLLGILLTNMKYRETISCMGIEMISSDQAANYEMQLIGNDNIVIMHNDEKAAIDETLSTIYIAQDIQHDTKYQDLDGIINVEYSNYELFWVEDKQFSNLLNAVKDGHRFTLLVVKENKICKKYDVVFTTLAVINLSGQFSYTNEDGRAVMEGDLCLWSPNDPELERYSTKSSHLEWHIRGRSVETSPKKSLKISLKDSKRENKNMSMLGMGEDDDWILNPLVKDDTKVKEKLLMHLWNIMAKKTSYNKNMTLAEYVEVVVNGEYQGLYLLQRRVDKKYLKLSDNDILLKYAKEYDPTRLDTIYEIEYSPLESMDTYNLMYDVYTQKDFSSLNIDNFVDINIFINFGALYDNVGIRNMFYILEPDYENGEYIISSLLWDTDLAFGVCWKEGQGIVYDYDFMKNLVIQRQEMSKIIEENPQVVNLSSKRWDELRRKIFNEEEINFVIQKYENTIINSGAYFRDNLKWGNCYGEQDNLHNLKLFIQERLMFLDEYYANIS